jgi:hypothetical protein
MTRFRGFLHGIALSIGGLCAGALALPNAHAADSDTETLVFVRHGEKPAVGYGQLNCQGLNRALALPAVIAAKFGKPDAIYAPDPGQQKDDSGHPYYYINPDNRGKLIVVAWEHKLIVKLLRQMLSAHGGNPADIPNWKSDDFDSIYTVRLNWQNGVAQASFKRGRQGLDGRSIDCPCAALPAAPSAAASAAATNAAD